MNTITISVVDDHPIFRRGVKSIMSHLPAYRFIQEAANGKEFIDGLANEVPDVVILDVEMPEMNGVETTQYLQKHFPQVKIIIATLHDDDELAFYLMKQGVRGYLLKEADPETFEEAITSVMGMGYYFNEFISRERLETLLNGKVISPCKPPYFQTVLK